MLEKMGAFFEARLDGYDQHMITNIESAEEFYPFTARFLPREPGAKILDLGCGTGLELGEFEIPGAFVGDSQAVMSTLYVARRSLWEDARTEFSDGALRLWEVLTAGANP